MDAALIVIFPTLSTAPTGKSIQLDFEVVELVGTCNFNFLEIFDQSINYDEPILKLCGAPTEIATIKTIGNILTLKLFAGDPGSRFAAIYDFTSCGGLQTQLANCVSEPIPQNLDTFIHI